MHTSISVEDLRHYVERQLNFMFPDANTVQFNVRDSAFDWALQRTEHCFKHVSLGSYQSDGTAKLNHLHSDQYAVFLWFLSNSVWKLLQNDNWANKLFYLNKSLHGFSCNYDTNLPDIFLLLHTVGTVLGKASYEDYLVVFQGSNVGAQKDRYPQLGKGVCLLPYSSVIGNCSIGDRVTIGNGAMVFENDVPSDCAVIRNENGAFEKKSSNSPYAQRYYINDLFTIQ